MKIINNNYLDNKDNKQIIREQNNFAKENQGIMDIQNEIKQIK